MFLLTSSVFVFTSLVIVSRLLQLKPYSRIELNVNSIHPIESIRIAYSQLYPKQNVEDTRISDCINPHLTYSVQPKMIQLRKGILKTILNSKPCWLYHQQTTKRHR